MPATTQRPALPAPPAPPAPPPPPPPLPLPSPLSMALFDWPITVLEMRLDFSGIANRITASRPQQQQQQQQQQPQPQELTFNQRVDFVQAIAADCCELLRVCGTAATTGCHIHLMASRSPFSQAPDEGAAAQNASA
ncbi:hypothetical protein AWZ03_013318 [Drosophila navojoa]|uniref:Uncharacterized protein n=1 Tax=Drosophila navojoa TaxID=7232 RepID=A0A484AUG1_DRONA|nr:hypothetical protein AWZ03_013318 [Drosophila navojoa]